MAGATTHSLLSAAIRACEPGDVAPGARWHLERANGQVPRPVCPARGQVGLAVRLAEHFFGRLQSAHRRPAEQTLAAVKRWLDGRASAESLRTLSRQKAGDDLAFGIVLNAAGATATLARGKPDLVHTGAQAAAAKAVQLLEGAAARRDFLARLDQEILCLEAEAAFAELDAPIAVAQVLWRGADEKQRAAHWVVQSNGGFAARVKLKRGKRAEVVRGSLDEVLAHVPETHFEAAVRVAMEERERPPARLFSRDGSDAYAPQR